MQVSIVIAVLNSHKIVVRQLRHFKMMNLPEDVEFILVDDGSNPPLACETCGLRNLHIYYTNEKRPWTQGLARNLGASKATGEYLFFTDIDHIISREAIDAVLNFNGDRMTFPRYFGIFDRKGNLHTDKNSVLAFGLDPGYYKRHKLNAGVHGNTQAIRRTLFNDLGGYDPKYCQSLFHVGGRFMSEERNFNIKWSRYVKKHKGVKEAVGPKIYHYPVSKFHVNKNNNPHGMFHSLSLEQKPQSDKP